MDYEAWIDRERRIRLSMLDITAGGEGLCQVRSCRACGEVCLCHEDDCPNCGSQGIERTRMAVTELKTRIRCRSRFCALSGAVHMNGKPDGDGGA